jgi:23S rRNA (uracil1939-C5)-methyltransferase
MPERTRAFIRNREGILIVNDATRRSGSESVPRDSSARENPPAETGRGASLDTANPIHGPTLDKPQDIRPARGAPATADVKIEKWVYGGDALARLNGRVVLAPFVLPGETVRVRAGADIHADLVEVIEPAAERVQPPCPVFATCGGCHYQHAPYPFQVARKVDILREQLRRVGKIDYTGEIETITGPPLYYRNRSQFHIADGRIGYLAARSHTLVPLTGECPISSPRVNQVLAEIRSRLSDPQFPRFVRSLEVFTNEAEVQVNVIESDRPVAKSFFEWFRSSVGLDYATSFGDFRVSPHSFFQVNRFLIEPLVDAAVHGISGATALDLYAGVGLFALPLARHFQNVVAVEAGSNAARDLEINIGRARGTLRQGTKIRAVRARVEDFLADVTATPDFVLADPPRAGLGKIAVNQLERLKPPRMTIVSCDPATLARDLAGLNNYRIEHLILADLFPQTYHMEAVAHLVRK